ncbi:TlpA family protein disulfide reductase [Streptomyces sp. JJ66]|uniref:TlpA family protein disulfide reductase n=1 Tax=Streptomyces sp. JJ66 TaxID=2803843 RepID=UPI001C58D359|nr:TlpA disulfide reductase family protein [Streptomyces sp. JJ66]MBW1602667.1 TlpA family protein disulfide reductase [Streptomyces sp. JJ66]
MSIRRAPRRRPSRRSAALVAAAATGALMLTACGSGTDVASGNNTQFVQGTGQITTVPEKERPQAPDLVGEDLEGEELRLSDFRGEAVVLNVWGSWCAPCRAEAPHFAEVSEETAGKGVTFLGINTRDLDVANAQSFDRNFDITYPSFYDPSGKLIAQFPKGQLNPKGIPSTLVIDAEGRIAVRALKPLSEDELREIVEPFLTEK